MFQTFEATTSPDQGPPRLARLREAMVGAGVDAFLVPRADAHQGEYVPPRDERLAWLTGFTGSAGLAAVLAGEAGVFVDGRYRLQIKAQTAPDFTPVDWPETKPAEWLGARLPKGRTLGFDPWLHTDEEISAFERALPDRELKPVSNLVDAIWDDQPDPPRGAVLNWPEELAGAGADRKIAEIAEAVGRAGAKAVVLTLPDSVSWLLNLRGSDIGRVPVVLAFAVLHADGRVDLFRRAEDLSGVDLPDSVTPRGPEEFPEALTGLEGPVLVDPETSPRAVKMALAAAGTGMIRGRDPCVSRKARKTPEELAATRAAHLRDGAAMVEFLCWLDGSAPGGLTEISVARALEGFRRGTNALKDISFDTIAGGGPNAAIVHYRVTTETDRGLREGELLLVDSGGQYEDGTTDVTRTVAIGTPRRDHTRAFTLVLKGMIALSRARWPDGLAGRDLDALARAPLWSAGLDYDHGTGHGVGVYLSVHEGPQRIARSSDIPLEPGMILSNEPGYYREGDFGIRVENLVAVRKAETLPGGDAHRDFLCFETLTWVPIDRRLIDVGLLSADERAWVDAYHARARELLEDRVSPAARDWLVMAAAPLRDA